MGAFLGFIQITLEPPPPNVWGGGVRINVYAKYFFDRGFKGCLKNF